MTMNEQEKIALYIAKKCIAEGMTIAGASGVLVNVQAESAFNPINVEDRYHWDTKQTDAYYTNMVDTNPSYDFANDNGKHYGYGLCQWTYPTRKTELRKICRDKGVSIGDKDTQIAFMLKELKRDFSATWRALTSSNSAYNCAWQFCRWFENPANPEQTAEYRASKVEPWLNFITQHIDDDVPAPEPTPAPTPTPAKDHTLTLRTIDYHCENFKEFALLKALLECRNYDTDLWDNDGVWDAVKEFQRENGLRADGIVGNQTWTALLKR